MDMGNRGDLDCLFIHSIALDCEEHRPEKSVFLFLKMKWNSKSTWLLLALVLAAGWGRWISASHVWDLRHNPTKSLYFDEVVYITLGQHLLRGDDYSLRKQYANMKRAYKSVPRYVNDPLFKHPPLVPAMVGISMKCMSDNIRGAFIPGLLFGTAMVALVFGLARSLFSGEREAWIAAFLLTWSTTQWICSARIILEAPLSFFILAGVACQFWGAHRPRLAWVAVVAWTLAWWTKYTAIPIWALFQVLMLLAYPKLLRNRTYWTTQAVLLALYIPWVAWRLSVDGAGLFCIWKSNTEEWIAASRLLSRPSVWMALIVSALAVTWIAGRRGRILPALMQPIWARSHVVGLAVAVLLAMGLLAFWKPATFSFERVPWVGDNVNLLREGPVWTYLLRLFWFEPITLLGMAGVFFLPGNRRVQIIKGLAVGGTIAITAWGNYQMRYLLPVIPFWEMLAAGALVFFYDRIRCRSQVMAILFVVGWLGWSLLRSAWLVSKIAIPNNVFYY
jgi:hypothetical protein